MPVITLKRERFCSLVDRQLSVQEMARQLPWLGVYIEEAGPDYVKIEFNPNRVDFSSYAGVARAFRGLMEWETGLPEYAVQTGEVVLKVDPSVSKVRPYMLGAVIRGLKLDAESVRELMEMQEDLHWGIGRDREKASIGVHNLRHVQAPFRYTTAEPDAVSFVPLEKGEEMYLKEILEKHGKGIAYSHLLQGASRYPLLIDRQKQVLSMPPIINGELTRVRTGTQDLFIDVTGTDYNAVTRSLNVLVTALADMGGSIESIRVKYPDREVVSPHLEPQKIMLRVDYANRLLGLQLPEESAMRCLRKCRLDAESAKKGVLEVSVPPYRIDILHEIDLVEEVAVGYGYYRLHPTKPATVTTGSQHRTSEIAADVRQIMIGLGFMEAMNFILTDEKTHYERMRRKGSEVLRIANPVSAEYSIVREDLLPSLMINLVDNRHESYPQRIFEVSDVVVIREEAETRSQRKLHAAAVSSHPNANFTEMKSYLEALLANLGLRNWRVRAVRYPSFLEGRAAAIYIQDRELGRVGEIHPQVLNNFELENPTGAFELNLEQIL